MPRRGDNIRQRKDGRWEARYPKGYCGECSGGYGSVYGRTYKEAKEKREQAIRQRTPQKAAERERTFADILYAWQDANKVRLKEASISRYQNLIDTHILPELGNLKISQITTSVINRFLSRKISDGRIDGNGGLSPSYVRSITLVISAAIDYGVREKLCEPLNSPITRPPIPKRELSILSHENQAILEQELLADMNEDKLLILITLYSGLRIGEVCALRWEDINTAARVISVRQTISRVWYSVNGRKKSRLIAESPKTMSSMRQIPICSKLYGILVAFPYKKHHGYILSGFGENPFVSPRTFEYRYKAILKRAGLPPINYHALRHTFATRCIEKGVDVKSLAEILGHADASITLNTYVHSSMDLMRSQLEKISL